MRRKKVIMLLLAYMLLGATEDCSAIFATLILVLSMPWIIIVSGKLRKFINELRTYGIEAIHLNSEMSKEKLHYIAGATSLALALLTFRLILIWPQKFASTTPLAATIIVITSISVLRDETKEPKGG